MHLAHAREQYVRWLLVTRDLSPHTIRAYASDLSAFERHLGGERRVASIDRDALVGFIEDQRAAGLSSTSLRRRACGLRGFCAWLVDRELLPADPWAGVTVAVGRARKLPRLVATADLDCLLRSLRGTAAVDEAGLLVRPHESTTLLAVALMLVTGVRVNEVVSLQCRDIDLPARTLRIVGKGRRERQVFLTNDWIKDLVRDYLRTRTALAVTHEHLLFNRKREPLSPAAMRSRLASAARDAGVGAHVTPHMLRHTAATQLIEAGVDIRYIQRLLGHASLSTTEIYTHVSDLALREVVSAADVLGRRLQPR